MERSRPRGGEQRTGAQDGGGGHPPRCSHAAQTVVFAETTRVFEAFSLDFKIHLYFKKSVQVFLIYLHLSHRCLCVCECAEPVNVQEILETFHFGPCLSRLFIGGLRGCVWLGPCRPQPSQVCGPGGRGRL